MLPPEKDRETLVMRVRLIAGVMVISAATLMQGCALIYVEDYKPSERVREQEFGLLGGCLPLWCYRTVRPGANCSSEAGETWGCSGAEDECVCSEDSDVCPCEDAAEACGSSTAQEVMGIENADEPDPEEEPVEPVTVGPPSSEK
jgi:hypothetical protein